MSTITSKEAIKQGYFTRTVKSTIVTGKVIDLNTMEISDEQFILDGGEYDAVYCGKTIEKKYGEILAIQEKKFLKATGAAVIEKRFGISLADLMRYGKEIVEE